MTGVFLTSCEKDPTKIGNDLLPGKDFVTIKSIDTLGVWSYTDFNDSTRTDNPTVAFLGQINDPYFGTTTAEYISQIRLGSAWDDKPFVIDSVKLYMSLLHIKGGTQAGYMLTIDKIANQIYNDSAYYSKNQVKTTGYVIAVELPALKADTINNISLQLPVSFAEELTRDTSMFFYSNNKADFRSYFKGLYFRISPSLNPTLVSFNVTSLSTSSQYYNYITMYMHDEDGNKSYDFILDAVNPNARYNRFMQDRSTASPDKRIKHVNDNQKDTLSYLQSFNGVFTRINIPGLEGIKSNHDFEKIAINKARLIVPVFFDSKLYKASTAPTALRLRYKYKNGTRYDVPDYYLDSFSNFFDGKLDSINNVYNFNITSYVQGYLKDNQGLLKPELEVYQSATDAKNVILKANSNKTPVKFEFTYTKF